MTRTDEQTNQLELRSQFAPSSLDESAREVTAQFLSGEPIIRIDPWSGQPYELSFDPSGVDLARLNSGVAPVLDSHSASPISSQIGVILKAWREGKRFFARLRFSDRPELDGLFQDVKQGVIRGISMGARVVSTRVDRDKEGRILHETVLGCEPYEVSLVSIPADAGAAILNFVKGNMDMTTSMTTAAGTLPPAENEQQQQITQLLSIANLGETFDAQVRAEGLTLQQVREKIFDQLAFKTQQHATPVGTVAATIVRDGGDTLRLGMLEGLHARATGAAPSEIGRPYVSLRLADLARICLRNSPHSGNVGFGGDSRVIELAMYQTSDFPNLLSGFASKVLLEQYKAAEGAIKRVSRKATAPDFKAKKILRRGEFPQFFKVAEGAQYTTGAIGESVETYSLDTFGRMFLLTRQAIINDDLGAFETMAAAVGQAAADFEDAFLVDLLTSNSGNGPTMTDTVALFNAASHGNKSAAAAVISDTTLTDARKAMRTQKAVDGVTIVDANPRYLVVPAALQTTAEKYVAALYAAQASNVNPFSGQLEVLVDPRLDAKSLTRWYLFADPQRTPCLEYAYLSNAEGVQIEQKAGFEVDGLQIKARIDFGAAAIDFRGAWLNG
jgi:HK97 family phage prohead protease